MNPEENNNDQTAAPSLDQVAADLTSAAGTNSLDSTNPTPESPAESTPNPSLDTTTPSSEAPATSIPTAPAEGISSQANDEEEKEGIISSSEEEPPLEPADPVPGSIGSELAYSETAPNHSVPVGKVKNHKRSIFKLKDETKSAPGAEPVPFAVPEAAPAPITPAEPVPAPVTPAEPTPAPETVAPTPTPETVAPTPAPETVAPTPAPEAVVAEPTPAPFAEPTPMAQEPATPAPMAQEPATPTPTAQEPMVTPEPTVPAPEPVFAASATDSIIEPAPGQNGKTKKSKKLKIDNLKLILIIGAAVFLIAVIVIICLFIFNGNNSSNKTSNTNNTNSSNSETANTDNSNNSNSSNKKASTVSSLTCTKQGGLDTFPTFGNVVSGKEDVVAMYTNDELTSFGTNLNLGYETEEAAEAGLATARKNYSNVLKNYNYSEDPFTSEYNIEGSSINVIHQADGDEIDTSNAKIFGFYVIRGEVATDAETLTDMFESNGYTCSQK